MEGKNVKLITQFCTAVLICVGVGSVAFAAEDPNLPDQQTRQQLRAELNERSDNWIIRYGSDGVHVMFVTATDPKLACQAADQVDNLELVSVTSVNTETQSCQ